MALRICISDGSFDWSYGVMVITLDFESSNPGSNPGRTSQLFFFCLGVQKVCTRVVGAMRQKKNLLVGESNPGRLRDRQKCYQLHQPGLAVVSGCESVSPMLSRKDTVAEWLRR